MPRETRCQLPVTLATSLVAGLATYLSVAPFECAPNGSCKGVVAFDYPPDSAGHLQAVGAGAVIAGGVGLLIWLVAAPPGRGTTIFRVVMTPILLLGIGISAGSHSILFAVGPGVGLIVLILMWSRQFLWALASRRKARDSLE